MKILFLDQSGEPGGAELCLMDIAQLYRKNCLVVLFTEGAFKYLLENSKIPVNILSNQEIRVPKNSGFWQISRSLFQVISLISKTVYLSRDFDIIYANTPKALIIGAITSYLRKCPMVYHLHDILSADHFSRINRLLMVTVANHCAALVLANSQATKNAFIEVGGSGELVKVVYNGFKIERYQVPEHHSISLRKELGLTNQFVIGHFSRLGLWKGQHILIEALAQCPENINAIFVGGAFFGVEDYVQGLHKRVETLKLQHRVKFLGFRSDIPQLMSMCDLVTHTSIAPEPFGRVIAEAMLCGKPVIAANAGGAAEIIEHGKTGWLTPPSSPQQLTNAILRCYNNSDATSIVAEAGKNFATQTFDLLSINESINTFLYQVKAS
jgi:glycosyltransferase involved in cell wall biosynthesis